MCSYHTPSHHLLAGDRDAEEDKDDDPNHFAEMMEGKGEEARSKAPEELQIYFLDMLLSVGEYTALVESIAGHEDFFGQKAGVCCRDQCRDGAQGSGCPKGRYVWDDA